MSRVPKWLRVWRLNPAWSPPEPTLANIRVDDYLTGNIVPVRQVARKHRRAYRDTLARLALAAHRAGYGPGGARGELRVSSTYRSRAEQEALHALYLAGKGPLAAAPGSSMHELGLAVDVPDVRDTYPLIDQCRELGLKDDVASERWHLTNHGFRR